MSAANYLTHSRKKWRAAGYYVEGTESIIRLPGGMTRRSDLFGFADLVALPAEPDSHWPWVFLQVTSWGHVPTRLRKIQREMTGNGQFVIPIRMLAWRVLEAGHRIVIEGWKQKKAYAPWEYREREVGFADLEVLNGLED